MRCFFRSVDLATLLAVAIVAAPLTHRLAAQDAQPSNTDSVVVVTHDTPVATIDLRALQPQPAPAVVSSSTQASTGASLTGLRSAVHVRELAGPLVVNAAAKGAHLGQSEAMMVVGGAALITGAIIGGDPGTVFMVGGAIVGLYGLYQYLQ